MTYSGRLPLSTICRTAVCAWASRSDPDDVNRAQELAHMEAITIAVAAYDRQKGCMMLTDGLGSKASAAKRPDEMA